MDFFSRFNQEYFFLTPTNSSLIYLWLAFYLFVLVTSISLYLYFSKKMPGTPTANFGKKILYTKLPIAIVGLFFVFCRLEGLRLYSWRFWHYLILLVYIITDIWLFYQLNKVKDEQKRYDLKVRKEKWLKKSKTKKTKHKN